MKQKVLIMFGGVSPEHEVSIISGLQIVENIDRNRYEPYIIFLSKQGHYYYLPSLSSRSQFINSKRKQVTFGVDDRGGFFLVKGLFAERVYPAAAYLAFHGGGGENGAIQGMLASLGIAVSSVSHEGAVITMNKQLTKEVVRNAGVAVVRGISLFANDIQTNVDDSSRQVVADVGLPAIIKPAHLGSSIGIKIAKTEVELQKFLLEVAFLDNEIVVEQLLADFTEFNCAVRQINGELQVSEIERPVSKDEILSFADKYQRGGKKSGSGMASLQRELPAQINPELKERIQTAAKKAFIACRCKGMVRIDFMYTNNDELYLTEVNSIPGSLAFYLWEASGIPFKQQITDLLEQSLRDQLKNESMRFDYQTDIVEKFVQNR